MEWGCDVSPCSSLSEESASSIAPSLEDVGTSPPEGGVNDESGMGGDPLIAGEEGGAPSESSEEDSVMASIASDEEDTGAESSEADDVSVAGSSIFSEVDGSEGQEEVAGENLREEEENKGQDEITSGGPCDSDENEEQDEVASGNPREFILEQEGQSLFFHNNSWEDAVAYEEEGEEGGAFHDASCVEDESEEALFMQARRLWIENEHMRNIKVPVFADEESWLEHNEEALSRCEKLQKQIAPKYVGMIVPTYRRGAWFIQVPPPRKMTRISEASSTGTLEGGRAEKIFMIIGGVEFILTRTTRGWVLLDGRADPVEGKLHWLEEGAAVEAELTLIEADVELDRRKAACMQLRSMLGTEKPEIRVAAAIATGRVSENNEDELEIATARSRKVDPDVGGPIVGRMASIPMGGLGVVRGPAATGKSHMIVAAGRTIQAVEQQDCSIEVDAVIGYATPGNKQISGIVERLIRDEGADKVVWVPSRNFLEQDPTYVWSCTASIFHKASQSTEVDCIALCELWKTIQERHKPAQKERLWEKFDQKIREVILLFVPRAKHICATLCTLFKVMSILGRSLHTLFVDEAGQVIDNQIALGIACALRIILVGDEKQLPPNVHHLRLDKVLQQMVQYAAFARIIILFNGVEDVRVHTLEYQYRSHHEQVDLNLFAAYGGCVKTAEIAPVGMTLEADPPMAFIDTDAKTTRCEILKTFEHLVENGAPPEKIFVISLTRAVAEQYEKRTGGPGGSNIDRLQGGQFWVVLVDLGDVPEVRARTVLSDFMRKPERWHVASTRAQMGLYVFGSAAIIEKRKSMWSLSLELQKKRGRVFKTDFRPVIRNREVASGFKLFNMKKERPSAIDGGTLFIFDSEHQGDIVKVSGRLIEARFVEGGCFIAGRAEEWIDHLLEIIPLGGVFHAPQYAGTEATAGEYGAFLRKLSVGIHCRGGEMNLWENDVYLPARGLSLGLPLEQDESHSQEGVEKAIKKAQGAEATPLQGGEKQDTSMLAPPQGGVKQEEVIPGEEGEINMEEYFAPPIDKAVMCYLKQVLREMKDDLFMENDTAQTIYDERTGGHIDIGTGVGRVAETVVATLRLGPGTRAPIRKGRPVRDDGTHVLSVGEDGRIWVSGLVGLRSIAEKGELKLVVNATTNIPLLETDAEQVRIPVSSRDREATIRAILQALPKILRLMPLSGDMVIHCLHGLDRSVLVLVILIYYITRRVGLFEEAKALRPEMRMQPRSFFLPCLELVKKEIDYFGWHTEEGAALRSAVVDKDHGAGGETGGAKEACEKWNLWAVWNIGAWGLRKWISFLKSGDERAVEFLEFMAEESPLLLFFQEIKTDEESLVENKNELEILFPNYICILRSNNKKYAGTGCLVRRGVEGCVRVVFPEVPDARAMILQFWAGGRKIAVINTYSVCGGTPTKDINRRKWDEQLCKLMKDLREGGYEVVLLGDLNVFLEEADLVWDGRAEARDIPGNTPEEKERAREITKGMVDVGPKEHTFRSFMYPRFSGRLDYIFVDKGCEKNFKDGAVRTHQATSTTLGNYDHKLFIVRNNLLPEISGGDHEQRDEQKKNESGHPPQPQGRDEGVAEEGHPPQPQGRGAGETGDQTSQSQDRGVQESNDKKEDEMQGGFQSARI